MLVIKRQDETGPWCVAQDPAGPLTGIVDHGAPAKAKQAHAEVEKTRPPRPLIAAMSLFVPI